jgi:methylated-DNA-[protein]-cysteine S-methyltransferase
MNRTMTISDTTYFSLFPSPLGDLLLVSNGEALTGLHMVGEAPEPDWLRDDGLFRDVRAQLTEYLAGERRTFDLPLRLEGTPFQRRVWDELCRIPFGETISYAELARRVGQPGAARAVGSANGRNRIGLIIPCHRVIAADGGLGGYGGGLDRKRWLLRHEAEAIDVTKVHP